MSKLNNGLILRIAIPLISIAFIAYGFYVLTDYRLDAVEQKTVKMEGEAEAVDDDINTLKVVVGVIEHQMITLNEKTTTLNETMKEVLLELRKE